jgi:hypothetical protein
VSITRGRQKPPLSSPRNVERSLKDPMPTTVNLTAAYNDFLFATVGEDRNDMPLSVVSALARLDLDPWIEAAQLARMPAEGATRRLSSLLGTVPNDRPIQSDPHAVAARLVSLLPSPATTDGQGARHGAEGAPSAHFRSVWIMQLLMLASMAVSLIIGQQALGVHGSRPAPERAASTPQP